MVRLRKRFVEDVLETTIGSLSIEPSRACYFDLQREKSDRSEYDEFKAVKIDVGSFITYYFEKLKIIVNNLL